MYNSDSAFGSRVERGACRSAHPKVVVRKIARAAPKQSGQFKSPPWVLAENAGLCRGPTLWAASTSGTGGADLVGYGADRSAWPGTTSTIFVVIFS